MKTCIGWCLVGVLEGFWFGAIRGDDFGGGAEAEDVGFDFLSAGERDARVEIAARIRWRCLLRVDVAPG